MANTYYDSQLTAAEIEEVLEAINGILTQANNGKVLAISNGKIEARSVQWGGGEPVLEPLSVNANGDYTPEAGVDGFDEVHVAVPNSYSASDEGKVVSNGALVAQTARASQITQNGTYDTTLNDEVTVNVSGGGSAVVQPLSVTQNGTYNPPSGVDGYAPVTVNVSGGGDDPFVGLIDYIESSGTQFVDTGYIPSSTTRIESVVVIKSTQSSYPTIFGVREQGNESAAAKAIELFWSHISGALLAHCGGVSTSIPSSEKTEFFPVGSKMYCSLSRQGVKIQSEIGTIAKAMNCGDITNQYTVFLFALNQAGNLFGGTQCSMKLYRARIYEGDTLTHEFLPWQENGVVCLKDTVTGNLKYNAGTGDFVYGTDS